jgi:hypothetical protein
VVDHLVLAIRGGRTTPILVRMAGQGWPTHPMACGSGSANLILPKGGGRTTPNLFYFIFFPCLALPKGHAVAKATLDRPVCGGLSHPMTLGGSLVTLKGQTKKMG